MIHWQFFASWQSAHHQGQLLHPEYCHNISVLLPHPDQMDVGGTMMHQPATPIQLPTNWSLMNLSGHIGMKFQVQLCTKKCLCHRWFHGSGEYIQDTVLLDLANVSPPHQVPHYTKSHLHNHGLVVPDQIVRVLGPPKVDHKVGEYLWTIAGHGGR